MRVVQPRLVVRENSQTFHRAQYCSSGSSSSRRTQHDYAITTSSTTAQLCTLSRTNIFCSFFFCTQWSYIKSPLFYVYDSKALKHNFLSAMYWQLLWLLVVLSLTHSSPILTRFKQLFPGREIFIYYWLLLLSNERMLSSSHSSCSFACTQDVMDVSLWVG